MSNAGVIRQKPPTTAAVLRETITYKNCLLVL